jgi:hypothetical protein
MFNESINHDSSKTELLNLLKSLPLKNALKMILMLATSQSRRIAFAEGFKTNATSIITSILNSPFHKSCCRSQMPLRRRRLSRSLHGNRDESGDELKRRRRNEKNIRLMEENLGLWEKTKP